jgi:hypothetical protein
LVKTKNPALLEQGFYIPEIKNYFLSSFLSAGFASAAGAAAAVLGYSSATLREV